MSMALSNEQLEFADLSSLSAVVFTPVMSNVLYNGTLNTPSSAAYFKVNDTSISEFLPVLESCTGRVNVYGKVCVWNPLLGTAYSQCNDDSYVPSAVNLEENAFYYVNNNMNSTGQAALTNFMSVICSNTSYNIDGGNGTSGQTLCSTSNIIYYILITPAIPFNSVIYNFKIIPGNDMQDLQQYSSNYISGPLSYSTVNNNAMLSWPQLSKCVQRDADTGNCLATSPVSGVNYKVYYYMMASSNNLDVNLEVQCGIGLQNNIVLMANVSSSTQTNFSAPNNGSYVVNVVAEFIDTLLARDLREYSAVTLVQVYYTSCIIQYSQANPVSPPPVPIPSPVLSLTPSYPMNSTVPLNSDAGLWNPMPPGTKGMLIGLLVGGFLSCALTCVFIFCAAYMISYNRSKDYSINLESPSNAEPTTEEAA
jgi:hypothetical protein